MVSPLIFVSLRCRKGPLCSHSLWATPPFFDVMSLPNKHFEKNIFDSRNRPSQTAPKDGTFYCHCMGCSRSLNVNVFRLLKRYPLPAAVAIHSVCRQATNP